MSIPQTGRAVRLKTRPRGLPQVSDFEVADVPVPEPAESQILVRNRFTRASASLRMMIGEGAEDVTGVPFPALRPGDLLAEESIGEVISARADSGFAPGDLVLHHLGWREFAAVPIHACARVENDLPEVAAHLSHGWTAYAALTRAAQVRPGDTVFITSAAGAIGSMAGQIARLLGAGRVIGSTGSEEKAARLVRELGYDATVLRGSATIAQQLAEVAPEGLDLILDNVGGEQLQAAIGAAREGARIVILGALSGQLAQEGSGRTAPVTLDSFPILLKKLTLRGYSADDDPDARNEWTERFGQWLRSGSIAFPHVMVKGIDKAPETLERVAAGEYFGTVIVEL
ncbi:MAG: NADP-dependent oxidoreductase [Terracidiphilus sp.]